MRRPPAYLVHADTDEVWTAYRAPVFETGSATVIPDYAALGFFVGAPGELVFLERSPGGTWSARVARQARRRPVTT